MPSDLNETYAELCKLGMPEYVMLGDGRMVSVRCGCNVCRAALAQIAGRLKS